MHPNDQKMNGISVAKQKKLLKSHLFCRNRIFRALYASVTLWLYGCAFLRHCRHFGSDRVIKVTTEPLISCIAFAISEWRQPNWDRRKERNITRHHLDREMAINFQVCRFNAIKRPDIADTTELWAAKILEFNYRLSDGKSSRSLLWIIIIMKLRWLLESKSVCRIPLK